MQCPSCQQEDAYVSLSSVECLNPSCFHFKESYLDAKLAESKTDLDALVVELGIEDALDEVLEELWLRDYANLGIPFPKDLSCD